MNIILGFLFFGLFLCAVMLGASRSPKAKGIVDRVGTKRLSIYMVVIIALIIVAGIIKTNSQ